MPSTIRTFLLRPGAFFEQRRDRLGGVRGGGLALGIAVAVTAVLGVALRLFAAQFTGTVERDNPARPPDQLCEDGVGEMTVAGCDEPATRTVEIGSLVWDQATEVLPGLFVGFIIVWLGLLVLLYVGAKVAGGSGRFGETAEVAAWGLLPSVVGVAAGGAALVFFAASTDLSASSPELLLEQVRRLQNGLSGFVFLAIQVGTAAWQAYVWAGGLRVVHEISRYAAVAIAVIAATLPVIAA
ncbi:Yip1-like protein [Haloarcula quadrata]|uniref:Yip1-like protein n=1 Tax=Haloarcula quadrata TaxID=182779 RepID=A0A495R8T5_9EURY|nr:YIP1 family protein [Haloarcula quadrata]RKS83526.1 Yip1-like protein [Haloarcula quadrata]